MGNALPFFTGIDVFTLVAILFFGMVAIVIIGIYVATSSRSSGTGPARTDDTFMQDMQQRQFQEQVQRDIQTHQRMMDDIQHQQMQQTHQDMQAQPPSANDPNMR